MAGGTGGGPDGLPSGAGQDRRGDGQPIRDPEREKQVLQSRGDMSPAYHDAIEAVFTAIMAQTREVEQ